MTSRILAFVFGAGAVLGGCAGGAASHKVAEPAWFKAREASLPESKFPSLANVPQASKATRTEAQAREIERGLWNKRAQIESSPRAEAPSEATAAAASALDESLRRDVQTKRSAAETAPPAQSGPSPAAPPPQGTPQS